MLNVPLMPRRITDSPRLASLPANYTGPVLMVSPDAVRPDPIHTPTGAPQLLSRARALGVPVLHMSRQNNAACVEALKARLPHAQVFFLGGNQGQDVQTAMTPGVKAFLRNTDPFHADVPPDFHGIITDEYYPEFQARVLQELDRAQHPQEASTPLLPVFPNPQPIAPRSAWERIAAGLNRIGWGGHGLAAMLATRWANFTRDTSASVAQAHGPAEALQALTPFELARTANDVLSASMPALDKSRLLYKVLTSHGTDPGHLDGIRSRMARPDKIESALQGPEQWAWASHLQDGAPLVGDWSGDFERYLDGMSGSKTVPGNAVQVCIDGDEAFPEQLKAIADARQFINLTTFAFSSDQFGRHYLEALKAAAARGVHINLIVDPVGSAKIFDKFPGDPHLFDELRKLPNVQFVETPDSPLHDKINHRKIITMDNGRGDGGQVGFIGGMNIADEYRMRWHDVHTRVEGPAVTDLNKLFIEQLRNFGGHLTSADEAEMMHPQAEQPDGVAVRMVGHVGRQDRNLKLAYLRAIHTAQRSIDIADPYVSDPDVLKALMARAREGVRVRLVMPQHNNHSFMKWAAQNWYPDLLRAGVEVYEYNGREMAHDKVAVFDEQATTIGSSNLDARSLDHNDEANLWSTDRSLAQEVTYRLFEADMKHCQRVQEYRPSLVDASRQAAMSIMHRWD